MKRKPTPYATLLAETRDRLVSALKRHESDPTNQEYIKNVERLTGDVKQLERYAAQEAGK